MAKYKILVSKTAEKSLKKVPKRDIAKIVSAIQSLALNPHPQGCRKLCGEEGVFRIRVGTYRIIYEVSGSKLIVLVLKLGHRKDVYR
jgi:mRNA interferase RelE/StbE